MKSISDLILGGEGEKVVKPSSSISDTLLSTPQTELPKKVEELTVQQMAAKNRAGFVRGLRDILDTAAHGLARGVSTVADTILPESVAGPIRRSKDEMLATDKAERDKYDLENPKSEGLLPNEAEGHRMAGQFIGTLPVMPAKTFKAIEKGLGALPIAGKSAPFLNRAAAAAGTGAVGGAQFGALTSSTDDKSTLDHVGTGLITGAIGGPVLTAAATGAQKILPTIRNMWASVQVNKIAEKSGLEPSAVKNMLEVIENAGLTPREAQLKLNQLGPQATLADLAQSLTTEASGLASIGGKTTEFLKGRYEARSKTANSAAHNLMETKLGPKPDIEAEKQAIIKQVQKDVDPDYKTAKSTGHSLDLQSVADDIDKQLENAVGPKAAALKTLKEYLYKTGKDANGNEIKILKHTASELHEIRQAIDDVVEKKGTPETSYGKNALNSINGVRNGIDTELKTIPEMAAADAKFADKMKLVNHIDEGYDILKNGMNKEEFARFYDALSPERQEAVRKGMRARIGDLMESATRGELSEAQRLFGKSSTNRANLEKAFGNKGTEVLDALEREAMERGTERAVMHGAQTAERQSIQRKYGERNDGPGAGQVFQGAALDMITGTPGGATAIMAAKRAGGHVKMKVSEGRRERMIEGSADIISRQGPDRDTALTVLNRVGKINNSIKLKKLPIQDLPTGYIAGPAGTNGYETYKKLRSEE